MSIPLNPGDISGAIQYPLSSVPLAVGFCPNTNCLPLQFTFANNTVWLVDIGNTPSGANRLKKIATLYCDLTASQNSITILFPDTGYQVRVEVGGSRIIPVLTSESNTRFYVFLNTNNVVSADDQVNILVLDNFIPEFSSNELLNVLTYGYGQFFEPLPTFTQSAAFTENATSIGETLIFSATQFYLTSIEASGYFKASAPGAFFVILYQDMATNENIIFRRYFYLETTDYYNLQLFNLSGLNYISSNINGNGFKVGISYATGGFTLTDFRVSVNCLGGILVA